MAWHYLRMQALAFTLANYWPLLRLPLFVAGMLAGLLRVTDDDAFHPWGESCHPSLPHFPIFFFLIRLSV